MTDTERAGARPRLLFLCQTLPYPPDIGVNIRTFNILKLLAQEYVVTALCFYRRNSLPTDEAVSASIKALTEFAEVQVFPIQQEHNRARFLWDHVRSVLRRRVYTRYVYASTAFRCALQAVLAKHRFDVVHLDSLDLATYLPYVRTLPVVCTHHNVESSLLRRHAETMRGLAGWYVRAQSKLMKKEEQAFCDTFALNIVVSEPDQRELAIIAPSAPLLVVPNGVDTNELRPAATTGSGILFLGGYDWFPNRDAMDYFVHAILPLIRARINDATVTWIGRVPADVQERYRRNHGVTATGYVTDIRPYVQDAACLIVPLRIGGGTRLKILDAWALGKAVVSTSVGCEGLEVRDGENILVRNDADSFANAVCAMLENGELRDEIGKCGRHTAERTYAWDVIGGPLLSAYDSVVQRGKSQLSQVLI